MAKTKARKVRESWGQIDGLPSGRLRARYTVDGRRYTAPMTFDNKTDARGWLTKQRAAILAGTWTPTTPRAEHDAQLERVQTFGEYAAEWVDRRISPRTGKRLAPRTRAEYERMLASDDFAALRDSPIAAVVKKDVEKWYGAIADSGRLTTASRAYQFVHAVFADAVADGPLKGKTSPAAVRGAASATTGKPVQMPTGAELLIIEATMPDEWKAGATIAAWGGARYGELTELRRSDVTVAPATGTEPERVVIRVERAVTYVGGRFIVGDPKSKSGKRSIILVGQDARVVVDHLERFVGPEPGALLFPNRTSGAAADPDTDPKGPHLLQSMHYRMWDKVRRAAGRPDLNWHALRHHFGTKVAEHGGTIADVQAALGDSTASAALRYVDTAADRLAAIAEKMGARGGR